MTTIDQLLLSAAGKIRRSEARLLLSSLLNKPVEYLIAHGSQAVAEGYALQFAAQLKEAQSGRPIPYITGVQAFWGRDFAVTPAVLIPRPDTETLVETVLLAAGGQKKSVLELGTGSGCIAVTLAKENPLLDVTATDISSEALSAARSNARRHGADNVRFACGSWFEALKDIARFDIIVSNPPYIAEGDSHLPALRYEPITALTSGPDGLDDIRHIAKEARSRLNPNGLLAFKHGFDQGKACRELLLLLGYRSVTTIQDLGGNDRVTMGRF